MKRLKQLRESMNITQKDLAQQLHTTQQTVARWESGKTQPDITALKDLALFFQTSVDDLLEYNRTGEKLPSSWYHIAGREEKDGFWGHVGVKVSNQPSVWFPVTLGTAQRLENALSNLTEDRQWVSFPTLANQYVCLHPSQTTAITILDDDADHPQDDWKLTYPYAGLPLELYRGFYDLFESPSEEEIKKILKLYEQKQTKPLATPESKFYKEAIAALQQNIQGHPSEHFIVTLLAHFLDEGLLEWERQAEYLYNVKVYYANGRKGDFRDNANLLIELVDELEDPAPCPVLRLESFQEGIVFVPACQLAMISVPYVTLLDKERELLKE